jgi:TetR/AcrR family transcriptional regulator
MVKTRDLNRTRDRILAAATAEFSAKGIAGARIDAIARRAAVNKRMLYYCFGSKQALYHAVLHAKIADKASAIESAPDDFTKALLYWYEVGCADLDWIRMLEWEALGPQTTRGFVAQRERRELFRSAVAKLRRAQAAGRLPAGIDLTQLFMSVIALTTFPLAFPQMTRLVTGAAPTNAAFKRRRIEFLRWLGRRISTSTVERRAGASRRPRARAAAAVR